MILNVTSAKYEGEYKIQLDFDNEESGLVDLKETIFKDNRKIFFPLRELNYFKSFKIKFNTISWDNEADFAPEFLLELLIKQKGESKDSLPQKKLPLEPKSKTDHVIPSGLQN